MKTKKQYTIEAVTFGYSSSSRKWEFNSEKYSLIKECPHGKVTAETIAKAMNSSLKRTKGRTPMDGLARTAIEKVVAASASDESRED